MIASSKKPHKFEENEIDIFSKPSRLLLKLLGNFVFVRCLEAGRVVTKFSPLGCFCFICWNVVYWVSVCKSFEQTIVRAFYDTKLKCYGDAYEIISGAIFTQLVITKLAFHINRSTTFCQFIVDVDRSFRRIGIQPKTEAFTDTVLYSTIVQIFLMLLRGVNIYGTVWYIGETIPYYRIVQLVITDSLALLTSIYFCVYLTLIKSKYQIINQVLTEIITVNYNELMNKKASLTFHLHEFNSVKNQTRHIVDRSHSEKIIECSKMYGKLYEASQKTNNLFSVALVLTINCPLFYIILNIFYFMEATSAGLFHDIPRYLSFLVYIGWGVAYNVSIIYLYVYFSEKTVDEAKKTSILVHKIINARLDPTVAENAKRFSLQLLHQIPLFTAGGLINLDYPLLLEGGRFLITFMGLLLQFAS